MAKKKETKKKSAGNPENVTEEHPEKTDETTDEVLEQLPDTEVVKDDSKTREEESLKDQFIRLQADFANFRNRTQRERLELYQRANEDILLELLPVLDHYEMGLQTAQQHNADSAVLDGFKMVYDQFQNVLKKFNVEAVDAVGEVFDPHKHEALTHMPSDEFPAETCSNQVRRGYRFGEKLLRAAQVVVSSGPANTEENGE